MTTNPFAIGALVLGVSMLPAAITHAADSKSITEADVKSAQKSWGDGIVAISKVHADKGDYKERASQHIKDLYAYDEGLVLFKPTLAEDDQFRGTFDEALSYFVGGIEPEDKGFAMKGWKDVRWENEGILINGDQALSMGNYYFTGPDGKETKVEYSFGYALDDDGKLRINLHHSSLPYDADS